MRSRKRRNPDFGPTFEHTFKRGGGSVELYDDGEVVVLDAFDNVQDNYYIDFAKHLVFIGLVDDAPFPQWHHYTREMVMDDVPLIKMARRKKRRLPAAKNPSHRRSRSPRSRTRLPPALRRALARIILK